VLLENMTKGGRVEMMLKKLYGARLTTPAGPMVVIHPIGRGTTRQVPGSCARPCGSLRGS
jgi:hypothetical protein